MWRGKLEVKKNSSMHHRIEEMIYFMGFIVQREEKERSIVYTGGDVNKIKHVLREAGHD